MRNYNRTTPSGSGGKHTYEPPKWRFGELLTGLGSDGLIVEKLVFRGYPRVPKSSIAGWRFRDSIPSVWIPVFIQMGLDEKLINDIGDLQVR